MNHRRHFARISPAVLAWAVLSSPLSHAAGTAARPGDPIRSIGHGMFFDSSGAVGEASPDFVRHAQNFYRDALLEEATPEQRLAFEQKQARFFGVTLWDERVELYIESALTRWLLEQVSPADVMALRGKLSLLQQATLDLQSVSPPLAGDSSAGRVPEPLAAMLAREGLERNVAKLVTTATGQAYVNECARLGVPTPPDWGDARWKSRGVLSTDFIGGGSRGEVYTYSSTTPEGSCIALPRSNGNTIELLGIICLGKVSSVACFWDNQQGSPSRQFAIPKGTRVPISRFNGGPALEGGTGGECTACHAGENPFIIHPGTALGLPNLSDIVLFGDDWYSPLVAAGWAQNATPSDQVEYLPGASECMACHSAGGPGGRFPTLSAELRDDYCTLVFPPALASTMPPGKAAATPDEPIGSAMRRECIKAMSAVTTTQEVFARGSDGAVWRNRQTVANGGWSGWSSLGGLVTAIEPARNADGRLEVFARGSDGALWHQWQTAPGGTWSGWESLGNSIDLLEVGRNADGRLEVFARGSDGALWHLWQTAPNSGWSAWESLGGWIDRLEIGENADGRLEVFARAGDGALWHRWQTAPSSGWSGWASLGGLVDELRVGRHRDGRLEVFTRGVDSALWHLGQGEPNGGWGTWSSLGGWLDRFEVGRNADGRLEVFARGSDRALWHQWQTAPNGGWSGWESLGGQWDQLGVGRNQDGRLEVFARGDDAAVWHLWQTAPNSGWSGWESLGGWTDIIQVAPNY